MSALSHFIKKEGDFVSWSYSYDEKKDSGIIRMHRGDTAEYGVEAYMTDPETGEQYKYEPDLEAGESIVFAVKENEQDEGPLFFIHCEEDGKIHFKPEHTRDLKERKYIYELSVNIPATETTQSFHCVFATGYLILDTEIYYDVDSGNEY